MKKGEILDKVYKSNLPSRAKQIMFYLINRANAEGTCFPSVKTIASDCGVSERTVQRTMKVLLEGGFILKENRYRDNGGQSSNLYVLQIEPDKAEHKEDKVSNLGLEETKESIEDIATKDDNTTEEIETVTFEHYKETVDTNEVETVKVIKNQLVGNDSKPKISPLYIEMSKCHPILFLHGERVKSMFNTISNLKLQCHGVGDKLYPP